MYSSLEDYVVCPICMYELKETALTPCNHRFCWQCISEWVKQQQTCPCCKAVLQSIDLRHDKQYDALINIVQSERGKAETNYYSGVIGHNLAGEEPAGPSHGKEEEDVLSFLKPLENVLTNLNELEDVVLNSPFTEHLIKGLAGHGRFCETLKKEYKNKSHKLESETKQALTDLDQDIHLSTQELLSLQSDLQVRLEQQKQSLKEQLDDCIHTIAQLYDRHLDDRLSCLSVLPVKASITLLIKDLTISDVQLSPYYCIDDLKKIVMATMEAKGDPVVDWPCDQITMAIFSPLSKSSTEEMSQVLDGILGSEVISDSGIQIIHKHSTPVIQYQMKPGSVIIVHGPIKCKSDLPKRCFAKEFVLGSKALSSMDYSTCSDCGFNWICKNCTTICHAGHDIVPYIWKHKPTWACCYCPKKKKCCIQGQPSDKLHSAVKITSS